MSRASAVAIRWCIASGTILIASSVAWAQSPVPPPTILSAACPTPCHLAEPVDVKFKGLAEWATAPDPASPSQHNDPGKLILALNGHLLKGLTPHAYVPGSNRLTFEFKHTAENSKAWDELLGNPTGRSSTMSLGVGLDGSTTLLAQMPGGIDFRIWPNNGWSWSAVAVVVVLLLGFLWLTQKSSIIRDPTPNLPAGSLGAYSLARTQMAWWFFIVIGSYLYIFTITGDYDIVTQGVLVLIGISVGAGMSSVIVDGTKRDQRSNSQGQQAALNLAITQLQQEIAAAPADTVGTLIDQLKDKRTQLAKIETDLNNLPDPPQPSQQFLQDILTDDGGISFHRFQMAAWTVVFGIVFVHEVWSKVSMPDFSATVLGLMGISSGTYIGFKIPDAPK